MRLAYLSLGVLERLVIGQEPPTVTISDLTDVTYLPWAEQIERVFHFRVL